MNLPEENRVQYAKAMKGLVTYGYAGELFLFDTWVIPRRRNGKR